MLLHRCDHLLGTLFDLPDANLTVVASRDKELIVAGCGDRGDTVGVSIADGVHQLAALRAEGADLAVGPTYQRTQFSTCASVLC